MATSVIITYPRRRQRRPRISNFEELRKMAKRKGLTENTLNTLSEHKYGTLKAFREIVEEDLETLPLYMGQRLILMNVVEEVNTILEGFDINDTAECDESAGASPRAPTAEELAQDAPEEESTGEAADQKLEQEAEPEKPTYVAPRKVPRPHDFIVGKNSSKELNMEEFLYGNLLILEYMMEQKSPEVRAYMKHLRFMVLKVIHGYPLDSIIYYDAGLRTKMEEENTLMPTEPDPELLNKYVKFSQKEKEKEKEKDKKKTKPKGKGVKSHEKKDKKEKSTKTVKNEKVESSDVQNGKTNATRRGSKDLDVGALDIKRSLSPRPRSRSSSTSSVNKSEWKKENGNSEK